MLQVGVCAVAEIRQLARSAQRTTGVIKEGKICSQREFACWPRKNPLVVKFVRVLLLPF
jgi:hypothetical protein